MKYFITGASGFVGKYLIKLIQAKQPNAQIIGTTRRVRVVETNDKSIIYEQIDLNNINRIKPLIAKYKPTHIIHLASDSSVGYSWKEPIKSFNNNVNIFLNLVESIRQINIPCRILSVGSSEEYGIVKKTDLPLKETLPLNPISPYAVARVAQEMLSKVYVEGYGLDIILTRSFNHFGPTQDTRFVIPSFVKGILNGKKEGNKVNIAVGDLTIIRDFTDVRDVVEAYFLLLQNGKSGEIYNVCSGKGYTLKQILDYLGEIVGVSIQTSTNPDFLRPNDNPVIIGDNTKIKQTVGWQPKYTIQQSLTDILNFQKKISKEILT